MSGIEHLIDTNLVIGLLKGHEAAIALAEQAGLSLDKAAVSQITRMELLSYSKLTADEDHAIRGFLASCQIRMLDETIEEEAIRLRRSGAFKLPDAIVAATAITGSLRLLTLDQAMVQGLLRLGYDL
jgi:predicted nucleic acid-binding protein